MVFRVIEIVDMTSVIVVREVFRKQVRHTTIVRFSSVNLSVLGGSSLFSKPRRTRRHRRRKSLAKILKNPRRAHPSADAHGHHAIASVAMFQFANRGGRKLSARTSERMPQSNRAPV